jgi:hypothetical protein
VADEAETKTSSARGGDAPPTAEPQAREEPHGGLARVPDAHHGWSSGEARSRPDANTEHRLHLGRDDRRLLILESAKDQLVIPATRRAVVRPGAGPVVAGPLAVPPTNSNGSAVTEGCCLRTAGVGERNHGCSLIALVGYTGPALACGPATVGSARWPA